MKAPWEAHERRAIRLPAIEPIDLWAEENIYLPPDKNQFGGQLSWELAPWGREILRMLQVPEVREITLQFGSQASKTLIMISFAFHSLFEQRKSCAIVMPREDDAQSICIDRFQPIILESPKLRARLTGAKHEMTVGAIRIDNAQLYFLMATSPADLAQRSLPNFLFDETDKYPEFSGREAGPIELGRHRTATFDTPKILKTSTPTTNHGYINTEYLAGDRRKFHVPCPYCNYWQTLVMGTGADGEPGIHVPPVERDPKRIISKRLAWYECANCHGKILDGHKPQMNSRGKWVPEAIDIDPTSGETCGVPEDLSWLSYQMSRLYTPWKNTTFSHVIGTFFAAKDSRRLLMDFRNSWLGEVWEEKVDELAGQDLRDRCAGYLMGQVPEGARAITCGVDVQGYDIWYVIRAWGGRGESWLIRCGVVNDFQTLHALLAGPWFTMQSGRPVPVSDVFIDFAYRTDEVLRFCQRSGAKPIRGASNPVVWAQARPYTGPAGMVFEVMWIDTGYYKNRVRNSIRIPDGAPGAWHLPSDTPEAYYSHMTAEQKILTTNKKTGQTKFVWKKFESDNHLFDCEVYAACGGELRGAEHWAPVASLGATVETSDSSNEATETQPKPPAPPSLAQVKSKKRPRVKQFTSRFFRR